MTEKSLIEVTWECENGHPNVETVEATLNTPFTVKCKTCGYAGALMWGKEPVMITQRPAFGLKHSVSVKQLDQMVGKQAGLGAGLSWSISDPAKEK